MTWIFNPCQPCCCHSPLIILAIYDESTTYSQYDAGGFVYYPQHFENWQNHIDEAPITIRGGLLAPNGSLNTLTWDDTLPYDSERDQIDFLIIPRKYPTTEDIVDFFNTIRGDGKPVALVLCLDNSGSMVVADYRSTLDEAKEQILQEFPRLKIFERLTGGLEEWLQEMRFAAVKHECIEPVLVDPLTGIPLNTIGL